MSNSYPLTYFLLVIIICDRYYHYLHFANEEKVNDQVTIRLSFVRIYSLIQKIFTDHLLFRCRHVFM